MIQCLFMREGARKVIRRRSRQDTAIRIPNGATDRGHYLRLRRRGGGGTGAALEGGSLKLADLLEQKEKNWLDERFVWSIQSTSPPT